MNIIGLLSVQCPNEVDVSVKKSLRAFCPVWKVNGVAKKGGGSCVGVHC